jgi:beta-glucosidase
LYKHLSRMFFRSIQALSRTSVLSAAAIIIIPSLSLAVYAQQPPTDTSSGLPFRNTALTRQKRVDDLLSRLTVEEKIGLLGMSSVGVPRLGVPAYHWWSEGLHGIARDGTATVFPQAIGLAATWDPVLHRQIADIISTETRAKNNAIIAKTGGSSKIYQGLTIWSPNINIFRDPRWGRGQETYGEDPYLTGRFAVAFIKGLQGDDPLYLKTVATVKHFAVHSGPEESRHRFDAIVSDRDLHETYLPAFEAGIREGGAKSLMSAYNAVDGIPAPANKYLLTDTLREAWGFTGAVVGDVDTVADIFGADSHHYAKDAAEASALALKAGNDLCSGTTYDKGLREALKRGLVTSHDLDRALGRLLLLRFELGQFDPPAMVKYRAIPESAVASAEGDALALKAAHESIVLLKNDGTLPWKTSEMKNLLVLGPTADDMSALVGNYNGSPKKPVTLLKGIRSRLEPLGIKVDYDQAVPLVEGFRVIGQTIPSGILFADRTKTTPGLKGELFANDTFTGSVLAQRSDDTLDIAWNAAEPAPGLPVSGVHERWTGVLIPTQTGDYSLSLNYIGIAKLYIDDKPVAGDPRYSDPGTPMTIGTELHLEAGHSYSVRIEYRQFDSDPAGRIQLAWKPPASFDSLAAKLQKADHILLTLGITPGLEGEESKLVIEGFSHGDRTSIALPKVQRDLLDRVAAMHKPFSVILTGSASLSFDVSKPNAILMAWYYGQSGGTAMADVLLGDVNPSGHLPVTFYKSDSDLPPFDDYAMKDRTYRYFKGVPLYPFGFGLSYSAFSILNASLSKKDVFAGDPVLLATRVTNAGKLAGDVVVQVYAHAVHSPVAMPQEWLIAFQRIALKAGESRTVSIPLNTQQLRRWDEARKAYVIDGGKYQLRIGQSSADTEQTVELDVKHTPAR